MNKLLLALVLLIVSCGTPEERERNRNVNIGDTIDAYLARQDTISMIESWIQKECEKPSQIRDTAQINKWFLRIKKLDH